MSTSRGWGWRLVLGCGAADSLEISPAPAMISWRGLPWVQEHEATYDPMATVLFAFIVTCDLCGHMRFFNSEQIFGQEEAKILPE